MNMDKILLISLMVLMVAFLIVSVLYNYFEDKKIKILNKNHNEFLAQKKYTDFPFVFDKIDESIIFPRSILYMENNGPDICNIDDSEMIIFDDYFIKK